MVKSKISCVCSLVLLSVLSTCPFVKAECNIPQEARIYNRTGKQCVWASIETLGRYNKIPQLFGITSSKKYAKGANTYNVVNAFRELGLDHFTMSNRYDKKSGKALLIKALKEWRVGAAFSINNKHMVVAVDITDKYVKIIDNADKDLKVQTWSIDEFNKKFDGWVIVVYKVREKK